MAGWPTIAIEGIAGCSPVASRPYAEASEAIAQAITAMNQRLGLPSGLAAMGVKRADFERIIDGAMADHCHKTNPRLATRADYAAMLESSL